MTKANSKGAQKVGALAEMVKNLTEDISSGPTTKGGTAPRKKRSFKKAQSQALNQIEEVNEDEDDSMSEEEGSVSGVENQEKQDGDGGVQRTKDNSGNLEETEKSPKDGYSQLLKGLNNGIDESNMTDAQKKLRSAMLKFVAKEVKKEVVDDAEVLRIMRREHKDAENSDFRRFSVISAPQIQSKSLGQRPQLGRQATQNQKQTTNLLNTLNSKIGQKNQDANDPGLP